MSDSRLTKSAKVARVVIAVLSLYFALTLPIVLVFAQSEYSRFIVSQVVTKWKGKLSGVESAYLGDSLTAGGRNWGEFPNALNLAGDGYLVRQVADQVDKAKPFSPARIYLAAGTNDVLASGEVDLARFQADYAEMLDKALATGADVVVTEIPFTDNASHTGEIQGANAVIRALAAARNVRVVACNDLLAPGGVLLDRYTIDGVHLSDAAYREVWIPRLHESPPTGER
jgi:lysophospholipase L1-like esterase